MGKLIRPVPVGNRPPRIPVPRSPVGSPRAPSSDVIAPKEISMLLPLSRARFSNSAQSKTEMPVLLHWFRNCWPLLTLPAVGVVVPPTATVFPFRAAMFRSSVQSAMDTPELLHWLRKVCPLLVVVVGVAEAATMPLLVKVEVDKVVWTFAEVVVALWELLFGFQLGAAEAVMSTVAKASKV